jgi:hypothetical protein
MRAPLASYGGDFCDQPRFADPRFARDQRAAAFAAARLYQEVGEQRKLRLATNQGGADNHWGMERAHTPDYNIIM